MHYPLFVHIVLSYCKIVLGDKVVLSSIESV